MKEGVTERREGEKERREGKKERKDRKKESKRKTICPNKSRPNFRVYILIQRKLPVVLRMIYVLMT